jgi:hypothetical protein
LFHLFDLFVHLIGLFLHHHIEIFLHLFTLFLHLFTLFLHLIILFFDLIFHLFALFLHPIAQLINFINNCIIDFFLEFVWLFNLPLDSLLHLLDYTIPLIFHISSIFIVFRNRFAQDYEVRKPFLVLILSYRHHWFSLPYHMKFDFIWLSYHFLHTILIWLADNCNDKVHKDNIAKDHYSQIYDPHENFQITILGKTVCSIIAKRLSHANCKIPNRPNSFVTIKIINKNCKKQREKANNNCKEHQKCWHISKDCHQHLNQKAELSENSE